MNLYWQVRKVTEEPGKMMATMVPMEWFKPNPEYEAHADDVGWYGEEFIDAFPGDEGAEPIEIGPPIVLDITDGPEMHALDNVMMVVSVIANGQ